MRIIVIFYFTTGNIYFKLRKWRKKRKKNPKPYPNCTIGPFFLAKTWVCWWGRQQLPLLCSCRCLSGFPLGCTGRAGDREGGAAALLALPCHARSVRRVVKRFRKQCLLIILQFFYMCI